MIGSKQTVMVFTVAGQLYGIESRYVQEMLWIPALDYVEDQPPYVRGAFDLRGDMVAVVDLNLRFGHPRQPLHASLSVIVVKTTDKLLGILADDIEDFVEPTWLAIESLPAFNRSYPSLIKKQFSIDSLGTGSLLNIEGLIAGETLPYEYLIERQNPLLDIGSNTLEKLRMRQFHYKRKGTEKVDTNTRQVAIVTLNGEQFGFSLAFIQEFTRLKTLFPLPRTPAFLLGNMNLRGEIVTVFDLSGMLGIDSIRLVKNAHVIIFNYQHQLLGVVVDELLDIVELEENKISAVPVAISDECRDLLEGEWMYDQKPTILVDVGRIFSSGKLLVDLA